MSRRNKLLKFEQLHAYPNVYENLEIENTLLLGPEGKELEMKGRWKEHFGNDHPITLELACGRGEYTLDLSRMYPNRNFIGVDIKGARIWKGATQALEENLSNACFLRTRIEFIHSFFEPGEIEEIWITFPDPFLRESKSNNRLTSQNFLGRYKKFLLPGSLIHLKTDSPELYEFTLEELKSTQDFELVYEESDIYS
ncbi:MAG: tRNA (guanosine(46)-N7)-methyltransferase TrmB, partial [Saprospiraceae bacterium]|nr:tRNA (guanosine(46)-N7)-methyltransferase TrmB [Saprospiraceae bacterium]